MMSSDNKNPAPPAAARPALRTLIVDDEALARARLRTLLGDCRAPAAVVIAEAGDGAAALKQLDGVPPLDLVLLDIHMPGLDGVELARVLHQREHGPAVIFVTAHAAHAVTAFELDAVDYLTKPVRGERLQQALQKAERSLKERRAALGAAPVVESLLIHDRGRAERIPLPEVLYLRSEHKYITVRTATRTLIMDGALSDLEARHADRFVRVHRNTLVARAAIRALDRHDDGQDGEAGWALRLAGLGEPIPVSRRMLPAVREAFREQP
ncbi:LytTR family DNA-binding domain-containing protein [Xenophilus arseniciresistens]|uniref:LytTR family DNA-binding domain-containing protein n=1 Tax=Xenophilus arseniciresistens TaxID=1283306 RepID=A0AAE3N448_9BURK|nr:LytTR family DNA-binding domain-containing protein [Xenophilus arseniciresistens]MDA7415165.1 LytTR family DNA-binding domain-containing protein [Xenophilus arseniciresistens]